VWYRVRHCGGQIAFGFFGEKSQTGGSRFAATDQETLRMIDGCGGEKK
jgi:hypothetical protein